jgi:hypothetical protein
LNKQDNEEVEQDIGEVELDNVEAELDNVEVVGDNLNNEEVPEEDKEIDIHLDNLNTFLYILIIFFSLYPPPI